jgi:RHS repeat-associated protein
MLSRVVRPDGEEVTFTYDALGRRLSKTFRGRTTRWIWDGNTPLHEWVEEGEVLDVEGLASKAAAARGSQASKGVVTWLFEPESFSPLAKLRESQNYGIVTDHLGTPMSMHGGGGEAVWSAELDIYGEVRKIGVKQEDCPFRFPGQYEDEETGLYYNRFRYYDPKEGVYVSQDPIGLKGGIELYSYVKDPNIWIDRFGLNGMPSLPERVLMEDGDTRIVHNYHDMGREHANPIHFHVEENGRTIAKVRADGSVIDGQLNNRAEGMLSSRSNISRLRRSEDRITRYIRATGIRPGGQDFRAGRRGPPSRCT